MNYVFENNQLIIIKDDTFRTLKQNGDLSDFRTISNQNYDHYFISTNNSNKLFILGFNDSDSVIDYFVISSIDYSIIENGTISDVNNIYNSELISLYNKKSTVSKVNYIYALELEHLITIDLEELTISKRKLNVSLRNDLEYFNMTLFNNEVYYLTKEFNLVKIITN
jgi:hypothetical protein